MAKKKARVNTNISKVRRTISGPLLVLTRSSVDATRKQYSFPNGNLEPPIPTRTITPPPGFKSGIKSISMVDLMSNSKGNGYVIIATNNEGKRYLYLVDAGITADTEERLLKQYFNMSLDDVQGIILTHEHYDHAGHLENIAMRNMAESARGRPVIRKFPALIYTQEPTARQAQAFTNRNTGTQLPWMLVEYNKAQALLDKETKESIGLFIESVPISHDAGAPSGYIISNGKVNIGILTDIGTIYRNSPEYVDAFLEKFSQVDDLFIEASGDDLVAAVYLQQSGFGSDYRGSGRLGHLSNDEMSKFVEDITTRTNRLKYVHVVHAYAGRFNDDRMQINSARLGMVRGKEKYLESLSDDEEKKVVEHQIVRLLTKKNITLLDKSTRHDYVFTDSYISASPQFDHPETNGIKHVIGLQVQHDVDQDTGEVASYLFDRDKIQPKVNKDKTKPSEGRHTFAAAISKTTNAERISGWSRRIDVSPDPLNIDSMEQLDDIFNRYLLNTPIGGKRYLPVGVFKEVDFVPDQYMKYINDEMGTIVDPLRKTWRANVDETRLIEQNIKDGKIHANVGLRRVSQLESERRILDYRLMAEYTKKLLQISKDTFRYNHIYVLTNRLRSLQEELHILDSLDLTSDQTLAASLFSSKDKFKPIFDEDIRAYISDPTLHKIFGLQSSHIPYFRPIMITGDTPEDVKILYTSRTLLENEYKTMVGMASLDDLKRYRYSKKFPAKQAEVFIPTPDSISQIRTAMSVEVKETVGYLRDALVTRNDRFMVDAFGNEKTDKIVGIFTRWLKDNEIPLDELEQLTRDPRLTEVFSPLIGAGMEDVYGMAMTARLKFNELALEQLAIKYKAPGHVGILSLDEYNQLRIPLDDIQKLLTEYYDRLDIELQPIIDGTVGPAIDVMIKDKWDKIYDDLIDLESDLESASLIPEQRMILSARASELRTYLDNKSVSELANNIQIKYGEPLFKLPTYDEIEAGKSDLEQAAIQLHNRLDEGRSTLSIEDYRSLKKEYDFLIYKIRILQTMQKSNIDQTNVLTALQKELRISAQSIEARDLHTKGRDIGIRLDTIDKELADASSESIRLSRSKLPVDEQETLLDKLNQKIFDLTNEKNDLEINLSKVEQSRFELERQVLAKERAPVEIEVLQRQFTAREADRLRRIKNIDLDIGRIKVNIADNRTLMSRLASAYNELTNRELAYLRDDIPIASLVDYIRYLSSSEGVGLDLSDGTIASIKYNPGAVSNILNRIDGEILARTKQDELLTASISTANKSKRNLSIVGLEPIDHVSFVVSEKAARRPVYMIYNIGEEVYIKRVPEELVQQVGRPKENIHLAFLRNTGIGSFLYPDKETDFTFFAFPEAKVGGRVDYHLRAHAFNMDKYPDFKLSDVAMQRWKRARGMIEDVVTNGISSVYEHETILQELQDNLQLVIQQEKVGFISKRRATTERQALQRQMRLLEDFTRISTLSSGKKGALSSEYELFDRTPRGSNYGRMIIAELPDSPNLVDRFIRLGGYEPLNKEDIATELDRPMLFTTADKLEHIPFLSRSTTSFFGSNKFYSPRNPGAVIDIGDMNEREIFHLMNQVHPVLSLGNRVTDETEWLSASRELDTATSRLLMLDAREYNNTFNNLMASADSQIEQGMAENLSQSDADIRGLRMLGKPRQAEFKFPIIIGIDESNRLRAISINYPSFGARRDTKIGILLKGLGIDSQYNYRSMADVELLQATGRGFLPTGWKVAMILDDSYSSLASEDLKDINVLGVDEKVPTNLKHRFSFVRVGDKLRDGYRLYGYSQATDTDVSSEMLVRVIRSAENLTVKHGFTKKETPYGPINVQKKLMISTINMPTTVKNSLISKIDVFDRIGSLTKYGLNDADISNLINAYVAFNTARRTRPTIREDAYDRLMYTFYSSNEKAIANYGRVKPYNNQVIDTLFDILAYGAQSKRPGEDSFPVGSAALDEAKKFRDGRLAEISRRILDIDASLTFKTESIDLQRVVDEYNMSVDPIRRKELIGTIAKARSRLDKLISSNTIVNADYEYSLLEERGALALEQQQLRADVTQISARLQSLAGTPGQRVVDVTKWNGRFLDVSAGMLRKTMDDITTINVVIDRLSSSLLSAISEGASDKKLADLNDTLQEKFILRNQLNNRLKESSVAYLRVVDDTKLVGVNVDNTIDLTTISKRLAQNEIDFLRTIDPRRRKALFEMIIRDKLKLNNIIPLKHEALPELEEIGVFELARMRINFELSRNQLFLQDLSNKIENTKLRLLNKKREIVANKDVFKDVFSNREYPLSKKLEFLFDWLDENIIGDIGKLQANIDWAATVGSTAAYVKADVAMTAYSRISDYQNAIRSKFADFEQSLHTAVFDVDNTNQLLHSLSHIDDYITNNKEVAKLIDNASIKNMNLSIDELKKAMSHALGYLSTEDKNTYLALQSELVDPDTNINRLRTIRREMERILRPTKYWLTDTKNGLPSLRLNLDQINNQVHLTGNSIVDKKVRELKREIILYRERLDNLAKMASIAHYDIQEVLSSAVDTRYIFGITKSNMYSLVQDRNIELYKSTQIHALAQSRQLFENTYQAYLANVTEYIESLSSDDVETYYKGLKIKKDGYFTFNTADDNTLFDKYINIRDWFDHGSVNRNDMIDVDKFFKDLNVWLASQDRPVWTDRDVYSSMLFETQQLTGAARIDIDIAIRTRLIQEHNRILSKQASVLAGKQFAGRSLKYGFYVTHQLDRFDHTISPVRNFIRYVFSGVTLKEYEERQIASDLMKFLQSVGVNLTKRHYFTDSKSLLDLNRQIKIAKANGVSPELISLLLQRRVKRSLYFSYRWLFDDELIIDTLKRGLRTAGVSEYNISALLFTKPLRALNHKLVPSINVQNHIDDFLTTRYSVLGYHPYGSFMEWIQKLIRGKATILYGYDPVSGSRQYLTLELWKPRSSNLVDIVGSIKNVSQDGRETIIIQPFSLSSRFKRGKLFKKPSLTTGLVPIDLQDVLIDSVDYIKGYNVGFSESRLARWMAKESNQLRLYFGLTDAGADLQKVNVDLRAKISHKKKLESLIRDIHIDRMNPGLIKKLKYELIQVEDDIQKLIGHISKLQGMIDLGKRDDFVDKLSLGMVDKINDSIQLSIVAIDQSLQHGIMPHIKDLTVRSEFAYYEDFNEIKALLLGKNFDDTFIIAKDAILYGLDDIARLRTLERETALEIQSVRMIIKKSGLSAEEETAALAQEVILKERLVDIQSGISDRSLVISGKLPSHERFIIPDREIQQFVRHLESARKVLDEKATLLELVQNGSMHVSPPGTRPIYVALTAPEGTLDVMGRPATGQLALLEAELKKKRSQAYLLRAQLGIFTSSENDLAIFDLVDNVDVNGENAVKYTYNTKINKVYTIVGDTTYDRIQSYLDSLTTELQDYGIDSKSIERLKQLSKLIGFVSKSSDIESVIPLTELVKLRLDVIDRINALLLRHETEEADGLKFELRQIDIQLNTRTKDINELVDNLIGDVNVRPDHPILKNKDVIRSLNLTKANLIAILKAEDQNTVEAIFNKMMADNTLKYTLMVSEYSNTIDDVIQLQMKAMHHRSILNSQRAKLLSGDDYNTLLEFVRSADPNKVPEDVFATVVKIVNNNVGAIEFTSRYVVQIYAKKLVENHYVVARNALFPKLMSFLENVSGITDTRLATQEKYTSLTRNIAALKSMLADDDVVTDFAASLSTQLRGYDANLVKLIDVNYAINKKAEFERYAEVRSRLDSIKDPALLSDEDRLLYNRLNNEAKSLNDNLNMDRLIRQQLGSEYNKLSTYIDSRIISINPVKMRPIVTAKLGELDTIIAGLLGHKDVHDNIGVLKSILDSINDQLPHIASLQIDNEVLGRVNTVLDLYKLDKLPLIGSDLLVPYDLMRKQFIDDITIVYDKVNSVIDNQSLSTQQRMVLKDLKASLDGAISSFSHTDKQVVVYQRQRTIWHNIDTILRAKMQDLVQYESLNRDEIRRLLASQEDELSTVSLKSSSLDDKIRESILSLENHIRSNVNTIIENGSRDLGTIFNKYVTAQQMSFANYTLKYGKLSYRAAESVGAFNRLMQDLRDTRLYGLPSRWISQELELQKQYGKDFIVQLAQDLGNNVENTVVQSFLDTQADIYKHGLSLQVDMLKHMMPDIPITIDQNVVLARLAQLHNTYIQDDKLRSSVVGELRMMLADHSEGSKEYHAISDMIRSFTEPTVFAVNGMLPHDHISNILIGHELDVDGIRNNFQRAVRDGIPIDSATSNAFEQVLRVGRANERRIRMLSEDYSNIVLNQAMADFYNNPDVQSLIKGYVRVVILDERTDAACAVFAGKYYEAGVDRPSMPQHRLCRCYYIPVLKPVVQIAADKKVDNLDAFTERLVGTLNALSFKGYNDMNIDVSSIRNRSDKAASLVFFDFMTNKSPDEIEKLVKGKNIAILYKYGLVDGINKDGWVAFKDGLRVKIFKDNINQFGIDLVKNSVSEVGKHFFQTIGVNVLFGSVTRSAPGVIPLSVTAKSVAEHMVRPNVLRSIFEKSSDNMFNGTISDITRLSRLHFTDDISSRLQVIIDHYMTTGQVSQNTIDQLLGDSPVKQMVASQLLNRIKQGISPEVALHDLLQSEQYTNIFGHMRNRSLLDTMKSMITPTPLDFWQIVWISGDPAKGSSALLAKHAAAIEAAMGEFTPLTTNGTEIAELNGAKGLDALRRLFTIARQNNPAMSNDEIIANIMNADNLPVYLKKDLQIRGFIPQIMERDDIKEVVNQYRSWHSTVTPDEQAVTDIVATSLRSVGEDMGLLNVVSPNELMALQHDMLTSRIDSKLLSTRTLSRMMRTMSPEKRIQFLAELDKSFRETAGKALSRGINVYSRDAKSYVGGSIPNAKEIYSILSLDIDTAPVGRTSGRLILTPDGKMLLVDDTSEAVTKTINTYKELNNMNNIKDSTFSVIKISAENDHSVLFKPIVSVNNMSDRGKQEFRSIVKHVLLKLGVSEQQMIMGRLSGGVPNEALRIRGIPRNILLDMDTLNNDGFYRVFTLKDAPGGVQSFIDDAVEAFGGIPDNVIGIRPDSELTKTEQTIQRTLKDRLLKSDTPLTDIPEISKLIDLADGTQRVISYSPVDIVNGIEDMNKVLHARSYIANWMLTNINKVTKYERQDQIVIEIRRSVEELIKTEPHLIDETYGILSKNEFIDILDGRGIYGQHMAEEMKTYISTLTSIIKSGYKTINGARVIKPRSIRPR